MDNLVGKKINNFFVISEAPKRGYHKMWLCRCDCGKEYEIAERHLLYGQKSCKECAIKRHTTHSMSHKKEYCLWYSMKRRCYNTHDNAYKNYGAKGVKVCDRWLNSFYNFLNDMGFAPSPIHSLDRFPDRDGNYEPSNCRWATTYDQSNNRRNNILIEFKGNIYTLSQLSKELNFPYKLAHKRYKKFGLDINKIFELETTYNL